MFIEYCGITLLFLIILIIFEVIFRLFEYEIKILTQNQRYIKL